MFSITPARQISLQILLVVCVSHIEETKIGLVKDFLRLARLGVRFEDSPNGVFMINHNPESSLIVEVKSKKYLDKSLIEFKELVLSKLNESSSLARMVT